jgi:hypothetical protein
MAPFQLPPLIPRRKKSGMACTACRESKVRVSTRFHYLSNMIGSTPQCERHDLLDWFCKRCIQRELDCIFERRTPASAKCSFAPTANMGVNQSGSVYPAASTSGMPPAEPMHYMQGKSSLSAATQPTDAGTAAAWYYHP